ncbi:hypothetical protein ACFFKE_27925 [Streptomyces mutabilis]|uniref:hypothetical protein n=1 Tax=Streptomyces mutabilis TaxID=67332 RepID=UPI0017866096|nr:hypothetical protein [Streptomyces mutabilis]
MQQIQVHADAAGDIDWLVQIDSTIVRAHQHAAATGRKGGSVDSCPGMTTAVRGARFTGGSQEHLTEKLGS